jgi:hypothetical protein
MAPRHLTSAEYQTKAATLAETGSSGTTQTDRSTDLAPIAVLIAVVIRILSAWLLGSLASVG